MKHALSPKKSYRILIYKDLVILRLSKSKGQILRVAATMFSWETPHNILSEISDEAMKAAIDFVETCNQHVNYLIGKTTSMMR